jgi:chromosome segregation ATPase
MSKIDYIDEKIKHLDEISKNLLDKVEYLDKNLDKISYTLDNIQKLYLDIKADIKDISKKINEIEMSEIVLENNVEWIAKLKKPVMFGLSGTGILGIIYGIIEYMSKR